MTPWRPRSPRHELVREDGITVSLRQFDGDECVREISAVLKQISLGGARLITHCPLQMDDRFRIRVCFQEIEFESVLDGRVAWARPLRGDDWLMGCAFSPELPELLLDELARYGYIDRRQSGRILTRTPAAIRHQVSQITRPAHIIDFSHGGVCLEAADLQHLDSLLDLLWDEEAGRQHQATIRVRWHVEQPCDRSHLLGCEFLHRKDAVAVRQHLEETVFARAQEA